MLKLIFLPSSGPHPSSCFVIAEDGEHLACLLCQHNMLLRVQQWCHFSKQKWLKMAWKTKNDVGYVLLLHPQQKVSSMEGRVHDHKRELDGINFFRQ